MAWVLESDQQPQQAAPSAPPGRWILESAPSEWDNSSPLLPAPAYPKTSSPQSSESGPGMVSRFATGFLDPLLGIGQTAQHAIENLPGISPLGLANKAATAIRGAIGLPATAADVDKYLANREADYQSARQPQTMAGLVTGERPPEPGIDWARLAGNVANPINFIGPEASAGTLLQRLGAGAIQGGIASGMQPVTNGDFGKEKAKQVSLGMAAGGAITPIASAVKGIVSPALSPDVRVLTNEGVKTTLGQTLGGAAKRMEDALTSIPLLGDLIKNAQGQTLKQFNQAAINRSLAPIGETLPENVVGHDAIAYASRKLSDSYDALLPKLQVKADPEFANQMSALVQAAQNLPDAQRNQFLRIIQSEVGNKFTPYGLMSGATMKEVEGTLGRLSNSYSRSPDYDIQRMGDALLETQSALRSMVERNNPQFQGQLSSINQGWANLVRVRNAAVKAGNNDGIFTPTQLMAAIKQTDPTRGKFDFAKGDALMQDLAGAGVNVLPSKVPDSGTPLRSMAALAMGAAGGHAVSPDATFGALLAGGAASIPYLPGVRNVVNTLLTQRPSGAQAASNYLNAMMQRSIPGAALLLSQPSQANANNANEYGR